jgi:hypothetical protein
MVEPVVRDQTSGTKQNLSLAKPVYRLAAQGRQNSEEERLALLEQIFDPVSRQRRAFVQPGWRCLEIGATSIVLTSRTSKYASTTSLAIH